MRGRVVLVLLILVALGIFAALNWSIFTLPTELHLGFARVTAPLGLVMLAVTAGLTLLYAVLLIWLETAALLDARRSARELQAQRQLAEAAEASRYSQLQEYLHTELEVLRAQPATAARDLIARLDQMREGLRADIERTGNTLAAYLGEIEDRLERGGGSPPPPRSAPP